MDTWLKTLLAALSLPEVGLSTVFLVALLGATLLPLASEPAVFGYVKLDPSMFWAAVAVATVGGTIGGAVNWWIGRGAEAAWERRGHAPTQARAAQWLRRFGPKACLLSWLPVVGDPLCAVAGWLRMPFWPCVGWMALGKFLRYFLMTAALLWMFPGRFGVP